MLIFHGCVCASCPPDVEHSRTQWPQHSPPPALGPLPSCSDPCTAGLVFPMERCLGGIAQSSDVAGGCQFKNSSAKRGCALLGNPKGFVCIDSVLRKNG